MERDEEPPAFPYHFVWEALGDRCVTIEELASKKDTYEVLFKFARKLGSSSPYVDRTHLARMVEPLGLNDGAASQLVDEAYLIAGWYLAPQHQKQFQSDLATIRKKLRQLSSAARALSDAAATIPPKVAAALAFERFNEPNALEAVGLGVTDLGDEAHDVALAAERVLERTARQSGRKRDFVRNTALRLAMEAVERAGLGPVVISRGTKENPHCHFAGPSGCFLNKYFELITGSKSERFLASVAERVRREQERAG